MKQFTDIKGILLSIHSDCIYFKKIVPDFLPSPDLLANLISEINTFAKALNRDQIKAIVMENLKVYIHEIDKDYDLNLIVIADRNLKDDKLQEIIDDIEDTFLEVYELEKIPHYMSDSHYFDDFSIPLNIILFKRFQVFVE